MNTSTLKLGKKGFLFIGLLLVAGCNVPGSSTLIPVTVENNTPGTPQLFGVPIPEGE